jgi:hypothetical protein
MAMQSIATYFNLTNATFIDTNYYLHHYTMYACSRDMKTRIVQIPL